MKFTNLDQKKNHMEEECEKLRLEIVKLYAERDTVLSEIIDQRRGKQVVSVQSEAIKSELVTIESILTDTNKALEQQSAHFSSLTEKQKDKIQSLNSKIQEKLDVFALQDGKEIIDIDSENRKFKKELSLKRKELQEITDLLEENKKLVDTTNKKIEKEQERMKKEKAELLEYRTNLEEREKLVALSEKRLEKYKEELLSKK